ncbi:C-type lectin protein, partial [Ochromonadaceae sp. CCMP2298]
MMGQVLFVLVVLWVAAVQAACPAGGWVENAGVCYMFNTATSGNGGAACSTACTALGANMICIRDATENTYVSSQSSATGNWIGFQRILATNTVASFAWTAGCTSTYTNFITGQPDGGAYVYVATSGGGWSDSDAPSIKCSCQFSISS